MVNIPRLFGCDAAGEPKKISESTRPLTLQYKSQKKCECIIFYLRLRTSTSLLIVAENLRITKSPDLAGA